MQTCKKCLHYEVCRLGNLQYQTPYERYETKFIKKLDSSRCGNFKDRSKFVELPCKVGDFLYQPHRNRISKYRIKTITIHMHNYMTIEWNLYSGIAYKLDGIYADEIGRTAFLTREEAEQALKNHIADVGKKERNDESQ